MARKKLTSLLDAPADTEATETPVETVSVTDEQAAPAAEEPAPAV